MKKLAVLLVMLMLFSTAYAAGTDLEATLDAYYKMMGLEKDPSFELGGFNMQFEGAYSIDEQTEDSFILSSGGESISVSVLDPESIGLKEEYTLIWGVDAVTDVVIEYMKSVYAEYSCDVIKNEEGIACLSFYEETEYACLGIMFIIHGADIATISLVLTEGFIEYMEYDIDQYMPDAMNDIFSGITLIA